MWKKFIYHRSMFGQSVHVLTKCWIGILCLQILTGGTVVASENGLVVTPSDLTFGQVALGSGETPPQDITLTNSGNSPVVVEQLSFGCSCVRHDLKLPMSLAPGETAAMRVWLDTNRASAGPETVLGILRGTASNRFDRSSSLSIKYVGLKRVELSSSIVEVSTHGAVIEPIANLVITVVLRKDAAGNPAQGNPTLGPMPRGLTFEVTSVKDQALSGDLVSRRYELKLDGSGLGVLSRVHRLKVSTGVTGIEPVPLEIAVKGDESLRVAPETADFGWVERKQPVFRDIKLSAAQQPRALITIVDLELPDEVRGCFHAVRMGNDTVRVIFEPKPSLPAQAIAVEGDIVLRLEDPDGPIARIPLTASIAPR